MSDDEEMSDETLLAYLTNPDFLRAYGYTATPKGSMVGVFMQELGMNSTEADELAVKVENAIFMTGYIYVHEKDIEVKE